MWNTKAESEATFEFVDPRIDLNPKSTIENANEFELGARLSIGLQRAWSNNYRLKVGITGRYHFTSLNQNTDFREQHVGFGPEIHLQRIIGY